MFLQTRIFIFYLEKVVPILADATAIMKAIARRPTGRLELGEGAKIVLGRGGVPPITDEVGGSSSKAAGPSSSKKARTSSKVHGKDRRLTKAYSTMSMEIA